MTTAETPVWFLLRNRVHVPPPFTDLAVCVYARKLHSYYLSTAYVTGENLWMRPDNDMPIDGEVIAWASADADKSILNRIASHDWQSWLGPVR